MSVFLLMLVAFASLSMVGSSSYASSRGYCSGGDSPGNYAGKKNYSGRRSSCRTICDADMQCTGYTVHSETRYNSCYTYTSRNAVGNGWRDWYCYMKKTCQAVNGDWGGWSSWSSCDCTRDIKTRTRQCDNPAPSCGGASCSGSSSSTDSCSCGNYKRSQGACSGGDSPSNYAGEEFQGNKRKYECQAICDADMQCTGFISPVNSGVNSCWTYTSRNAVGDGHSIWYCYMKGKE